jgi:ribosome-binding factor A
MALSIRECFSKALLKDDIYGLPCQNLTITHVDLSPDLRNAKVFVMSSENSQKEKLIGVLEKNKHYFKNIIATQLKMRFIPEIAFKIDDSFEKLQRIDEILRDNDIQA